MILCLQKVQRKNSIKAIGFSSLEQGELKQKETTLLTQQVWKRNKIMVNTDAFVTLSPWNSLLLFSFEFLCCRLFVDDSQTHKDTIKIQKRSQKYQTHQHCVSFPFISFNLRESKMFKEYNNGIFERETSLKSKNGQVLRKYIACKWNPIIFDSQFYILFELYNLIAWVVRFGSFGGKGRELVRYWELKNWTEQPTFLDINQTGIYLHVIKRRKQTIGTLISLEGY